MKLLRMAHQLPEIAGPTRNAVIQHQIPPPGFAAFDGLVIYGRIQMPRVAQKLLPQPKLKRGYKRFDVSLDLSRGHRQQHADRLRSELPVQIAGSYRLLLLGFLPIPAPRRVNQFAVAANLSAGLAQLE